MSRKVLWAFPIAAALSVGSASAQVRAVSGGAALVARPLPTPAPPATLWTDRAVAVAASGGPPPVHGCTCPTSRFTTMTATTIAAYASTRRRRCNSAGRHSPRRRLPPPPSAEPRPRPLPRSPSPVDRASCDGDSPNEGGGESPPSFSFGTTPQSGRGQRSPARRFVPDRNRVRRFVYERR